MQGALGAGPGRAQLRLSASDSGPRALPLPAALRLPVTVPEASSRAPASEATNHDFSNIDPRPGVNRGCPCRRRGPTRTLLSALHAW